jgi:FlaA1/EpsC-like NDP-sugar epimerase
MRGAVKMVRKPGKSGRKVHTGPYLATIEEDLMVSQVVHGRRSAHDMSPKEIMLDNMHKFQQTAYESEAFKLYALKSMPEGEERRRLVEKMELEEERLRRLASDEARNVAPYIHSRKIPTTGTGETLGENIVRTMLDEIDRLNREHPMVIEHIPQKKTA